jgi:hypothetical protein
MSTWIFYRVVRSNPPTLEDLTSHVALGKAPATTDPIRRRMAEGLSVFATFRQARRNARSFPGHGGYVAELVIPEDAPVSIERTGHQAGHHTIWGDPVVLLRCVASVVPVWTDRRSEA